MTNTVRILAISLAILALMAATIACRDDTPAPATSAAAGTAGVAGETMAAAQTAAPPAQASGSQTGIWVTGEGSVDLNPDLALLNVGVEVEAATVSEARGGAATAMAAVIAAVKNRGLTDADIQTSSFNIWPRYDYIDGKQTLAGYRVANSVTVKIRDLNAAGDIIDDVADAGGDATRIDGINFTVEDPMPYLADLREAAVRNAQEKAQHYADLIGASLGDLVYLTEAGGGAPPVPVARAELAFADSAARAKTSVSGGELTLRLSVQAAFAIE